MSRLLLGALAAILVTACAANPKTSQPETTVKDGASAVAAAPAPATEPIAAAPAPGTCTTDAQCADGERCSAGRCAPATDACGLGVVRVRFAFDSAQLDDAAMKGLRDDADCLSRRRPSTLLIEGHCDERGTAQYNIALGARRADAVRKYLADLGVKTKFDTVSFGKELPVAQGSTESAWAQNRRAELRLPGDKRSDGQLVAGR
jgi:outer membrane protein OmpA-like peptidoglycan-associated protein